MSSLMPDTHTVSWTLASPNYERCTPQIFDKRVDLDSKPLDEFTAGRTFFGLIT